MPIEISNGRVFVEGKETVDPVLIGYAVLDAIESETVEFITISKEVYRG